MKKQKAFIFIIVLLAITVVAAFLHLNTREEVPENGIQITASEETYVLNIDKLKYENVTGTYVTGKGEERKVDEPGILVKDILAEVEITEYTKIIVTADDSYSVEVTAEEAKDDAKAYLIKEEDSLRLIVFGDENSKRNVKNVVQIDVESSEQNAEGIKFTDD